MHTPNWPTEAPFYAQVERIRSDGNWIVGDPLDTATRPKGTNGTPWAYPPRLMALHQIDGAPLPDIPGWEKPRLGFRDCYGVMIMQYEPADNEWTAKPARSARPVQLDLFDYLDSTAESAATPPMSKP